MNTYLLCDHYFVLSVKCLPDAHMLVYIVQADGALLEEDGTSSSINMLNKKVMGAWLEVWSPG